MKILHIVNGYCSSALYKHLLIAIRSNNIEQEVYVPIRSDAQNGLNQVPEIQFHYSHIITSILDRLNFFRKIKKLYRDIKVQTDIKNVSIIHAHTLFSDGAVALKLYNEYNIPYIVAVRNTDINLYFKYLFYCRNTGINILINAKRVIFLSESYKELVIDKYVPKKLRERIRNKSIVIPNGISEFWLNNFDQQKKKINKRVEVLYVGEFKQNKNIHSIITAIEKIRCNGIDAHFVAVGLGLSDELNYVKRLIKQKKEYVTFQPSLNNKNELIECYRKANLFVMPSFTETFGLVYVEALTQRLPIIYTQNEGFDRQFDDGEVGYSVNPSDINDISDKIIQILNNYELMQENISLSKLKKFDWNYIGKQYITIYKS